LVALGVLALRHLSILARATGLVRNRGQRVALLLVPVACLVLIRWVLEHWSDPEVRGHQAYVRLFLQCGGLWIGGGVLGMRTLGVSAVDDVVQSRNPAATVAVCGGMLGAALCFAGANVGLGPTIWTTLVPAAMATALWLAVVVAADQWLRSAAPVVMDRDLGAGGRLAVFLVAEGLIFGGAAAGDWVSTLDMELSFARAMPAALAVAAVVVGLRKAAPWIGSAVALGGAVAWTAGTFSLH
jgi:hypothetical protein